MCLCCLYLVTAVAGILDNRPNFETVLKQYHKKIYNLAFRVLGNADEAADLTQETFVKAYNAYSRFNGEGSALYPWLCRIAVNGCKNRFREISRRGQFEALSLDKPLEADGGEFSLDVSDESSDPAGIAQHREMEQMVQRAVTELPQEYRVVVVLRDMQGLSYKEIAEITGQKVDNVKVRLYRGRLILRRRLSNYISD
jgi:RNA polymerase sigma-70 factor (ECF subfamily)